MYFEKWHARFREYENMWFFRLSIYINKLFDFRANADPCSFNRVSTSVIYVQHKRRVQVWRNEVDLQKMYFSVSSGSTIL